MRTKANLAILVCLILLGLVSASTFLHFYSTFIPRYFDQSATVLEFYDAYYLWKDGTAPLYDFFGALLKLQTMKGGLTQDVGFLTSIFLGPNRLSLWLPNFGALVLFLAVVYNYASRTMSKEAALIIAALTLLGPAIYMPAGGLYDLRWDFVGIMMFGCFLFSFWKLINQNSKKNMAIVIVFSLIAIDVRSINMAFVGLTIFGVALVFLLLLILKSLRSYALGQIKTLIILGSIVLMFYAAFAIIHWEDINSYYLDRTLPGRLLSAEKLIRIKESGAEGGVLMFFIQFTLKMYKSYFGYTLLVLAVLWSYWWISRRSLFFLDLKSVTTDFPENRFRWRIEGVVIAIVASISVLLPSSLYAPNPIPPSYLIGAYSFLMVCAIPPMNQKEGRFFLWVILIALFSIAVVNISSMQSWSKSEMNKQSNALQLFQSVLSNKQEGGHIFFSIVDEALLPETFMIWLYENGYRMEKGKYSATSLDILPLSIEEYVTQFSKSDIIFRWDKAPSKTTYPSEEQAIGETVNNLWARYVSQFVRLKEMPYKDGVVGVYARRVHIVDTSIPLWVEKEGIFWLGDEHARISIVNSTATVLPAKISSVLSLGPSVPNGSQVKLCVMSGKTVINCFRVSTNNYDFETVVPVDPGANEVELFVVHDDDMIFSPIHNDSRRLLLKVVNLRASEAGQ